MSITHHLSSSSGCGKDSLGQCGCEGQRAWACSLLATNWLCFLDLFLICKTICKSFQASWTLFRDIHMP